MKQFVLWMAVIGLATTGCAQNRVLGPHARRGGADFQVARSQSTPRPNFRTAMRETEASLSESEIELAMYGGGRCRGNCGSGDACCGGCEDGCCGGGCDSGCSDGCCGGGGRGCSSGCSDCGGRGCGLCQRLAGRVASGFCPHGGGYPESYNYNPSPPTGQVAYPYYTVRGPRDFLRNNPPSIGPY